MMRRSHSAGRPKSVLAACVALLLALCMLPAAVLADGSGDEGEWVNFLLICNEGMNNDKGNAGNTMMVAALHPQTGTIKLMVFTWDTFIDYEGYDVPQRIDMPYRNNGAEELLKVFNSNFSTDIRRFMSLNYLNLASLIDAYDGVTVDITRAERNALNGMVASKKNQLQAMAGKGLLSQALLDSLASDYYLEEYGPDTALNGLQAVGFGWLQYDSVYNCCERELKVVAGLFASMGHAIARHAVFYTNAMGRPEVQEDEDEDLRYINLDDMSEEDRDYLLRAISPVFDMSYNNMEQEDIEAITWTFARSAYEAARQGYDVFRHIEYLILPLEATEPYDIIAGAKGHLVDKDANAAAIHRFLFTENGIEDTAE